MRLGRDADDVLSISITLPSHFAVTLTLSCLRLRSAPLSRFRVRLIRFATGLRPNWKCPRLVSVH